MKFAFADFEFDPERHELRRAGKVVKADATVVRLLAALLSKAPQLVSKEELVDLVWEGRAIADNVLAVTIARLRRLLNHRRDEHEFITTAYGQGYRFSHPFEQRGESRERAVQPTENAESSLRLVGRDRELATLGDALGRAAVGRGRLCTILGEPGIGKTYLVEALERRIAHGQAQVAWGFCREAGDTPPLGPWLRLIREIEATADRLGWPLRDDPVVAELAQAMRAIDLRNLHGVALPDLIHHMSVEGPKRHRLFDVIARFLALAARHAPWLLVFENLHQADVASLELLQHVLDEVMRTRILIVATLRPVALPGASLNPARLSQVLGHRNCERIVLERLGEREVSAYVGALVDDPSGSVARAVFTKSEGNPFFMAEFTRQQASSGQLGVEAMTLPAAALDLLRQQLATLDAKTYGVLAAAAVIGRSFELPLLRIVTELDASHLMACVDEAIVAGVVIASPDTKTGFAFGHELLRGVLYDALSPSERRRWHLRIAEALEARSEAGDPVPPSELAHHFHAAIPETDLCKAVRYCRKAAASAALTSGVVEVVRYTHQALEALEMFDRPSRRLRMHLLYVTAMFTRGYDMDEFMRATRELIALAREQNDARILVCAGMLLNLHPGFTPVPGAAPIMERALALLPAEKRGLRASALAGLATAAPACFSAEAYALIDDAVAEARASTAPIAHCVALLGALYLYGGPRHATRATALAKELDDLARETAMMPLLSIDVSFHRMVRALSCGDLTAADAAIERATIRSRQLQHNELLWHCARYRVLARLHMGQLEHALAELASLHRQAEQDKLFGTAPFCAFDRVVIFGEQSGAVARSESIRLALAYDAADPPSIWALKLRALAAAGLHDEARMTLHALAPTALAGLPCDTHYLGTLGQLARAVMHLGERAYFEPVYGLLQPFSAYYAMPASLYGEGAVPHLLGLLAQALGRDADAIAQLERGIAMNERAGLSLRALEGRLALAACLAERGKSGDHKRARSLRRQAQEMSALMGTRRLAAEHGRAPVGPSLLDQTR